MKHEIDIFAEKTSWTWSPKDLNTFLGGTQEWMICLAKALQERGHAITIWWDGEEEDWSGVAFRKRRFYSGNSDVVIGWNHPSAFPPRIKAERIYYWTNADHLPLTHDSIKSFDAILANSQYQSGLLKKEVLDRTGQPDLVSRVYAIYPGIDDGEFSLDKDVDRDPNLAIFASSWDRGLHRLVGCMPTLLRRFPRLKLQVCYNREFMKKVTGRWESIPQEWKGVGIEFSSPTRKEMGLLYRKASYLLYPCTGIEMFCLTAWKAQYAGCLPITTNEHALRETVIAGSAVPISSWLEEAVRVMDSPAARKQLLARKSSIPFLSWPRVAECWEELFALERVA